MMIHLKGKQIKKPWQVILRTNGTPLCQVFGPYRFGCIASVVAFFVSFRIWVEDIVCYHPQHRFVQVFEVSEYFAKDPLEQLESLHKEINTMLEQEGYKDPV